MAALLDIFEDAAVDRDTVAFLLDALDNADAAEQGDILEPFLNPSAVGKARTALAADPGLVKMSREIHEMRIQVQLAKEHPNAGAMILRWALDGLEFCDTYSLGRFYRLCREAQALVRTENLWEPRVRSYCLVWSLPLADEETRWRELFFSQLRPRLDGVYVGHCGYVHKVRPGASMTDRRTSMWIDYRRYLRLFPPDEDGVLRALVLQDAGPLDLALEVLLDLDPRTHVGAVRQHNLSNGPQRSSQQTIKEARAQVVGRTFTATYDFREGQVVLTYQSDSGVFNILLRVNHRRAGLFSERLEWETYSLTSGSGEEPLRFKLDRNCYGDAADPACDHFAAFQFRPAKCLEHLL